MRNDDRGFALVSVLVISVGLLTVVSGLLMYASTTNKRAVTEEQRARAFYAAESGINHTLALLRNGVTLPNSNPPSKGAIPDGEPALTSSTGTLPEYKVWLYIDPEDQQRKIVAQGEDGIALRNVSVAVTGSNGPSLEDGSVVPITWPSCTCDISGPSKGKIEVNAGNTKTITAPGIYDSINVNSNGKLYINTSGAIKVKGQFEVNANAEVIVNADGPTSLCASNLNLNSNSLLDIRVDGPVSICSSGLSINSNATLNLDIEGAVTMCANTVNMNSNGKLKIARNASLTTWINGNLELNSNFLTTDYGDDSQDETTWPRIVVRKGLSINSNVKLGASGRRPVLLFMDPTYTNDVTLNANAELYGAIWAPTRKVTLNSNSRIYGTVIYKKLVTNSNSHITDQGDFSHVHIPGTSTSGSAVGIGNYTTK